MCVVVVCMTVIVSMIMAMVSMECHDADHVDSQADAAHYEQLGSASHIGAIGKAFHCLVYNLY
jgi:hypothetical protein